MVQKKDIVRASDIGGVAYCPYQLYLRRSEGDSEPVKKNMDFGNRSHEEFNQQYRSHGLSKTVILLILLVVASIYMMVN